MTMMLAIGSALWLGMLTSISPCPLASNIAAISFIGRKVGSTRHVLLSGLLYTAGRTIAYLALGVLVLAGLLAGGEAARFLQRNINQILGPVLILGGMALLGMIDVGLRSGPGSERLRRLVSEGGTGWALVLGALFALSFCPVSAGLFFGGLIPLSAAAGSLFTLPVAYGLGTALPVIVFAFVMAFASKSVGTLFARLTQVERWARVITGAALVLIGVYYSLVYVWGVGTAS